MIIILIILIILIKRLFRWDCWEHFCLAKKKGDRLVGVSERVFFWVFIFHWDFAVPSLAEEDNFKYIKSLLAREKIMLIYFTTNRLLITIHSMVYSFSRCSWIQNKFFNLLMETNCINIHVHDHSCLAINHFLKWNDIQSPVVAANMENNKYQIWQSILHSCTNCALLIDILRYLAELICALLKCSISCYTVNCDIAMPNY